MMIDEVSSIKTKLVELSQPLCPDFKDIAIILAAGQGKRIKSNSSKMLHKIWGVPTVIRVADSAKNGLSSPNQIIVVGIKALEVAETLGPAKGRLFAFQAEQKGTGHAVKVALNSIDIDHQNCNFYIFPGDMGLIDAQSVRSFKMSFLESKADMMVMTGNYQGDALYNYYGRIIRVPPFDAEGRPTQEDCGKIIQIIEYKDIMALNPQKPLKLHYRGHTFQFSREELLNYREYNSGLYAFHSEYLFKLIDELGFENVQGEMYLTDLIYLFNKAGLTVAGCQASTEEELIGFNDKYVLNQMESIARNRVYNKLGSIISIIDKTDFFIADDVTEHILQLDAKGEAHDIVIKEGAYLGTGVRLNEGVQIGRAAKLEGRVKLGKGVFIGDAVQISCYPDQTVEIGDYTKILKDDVLKGNISIGHNCLIESPVRLTGSTEAPLRIGNNVRIKGASYLYGCIVQDNCFIINCVLKEAKITCRRDKEGKILPICYIFPEPEGKECISPLI